jgi:DNA ligase-1
MHAIGKDTNCFEDLEAFLDSSIKDCCEGLMVKTLNFNSTYEPSKRSFNWLKLKKDYLNSGLGDSVDLTVIGAEFGQGKRTGWYGSFLLAAYDDDREEFFSVCKVGTGFSEELLAKVHK